MRLRLRARSALFDARFRAGQAGAENGQLVDYVRRPGVWASGGRTPFSAFERALPVMEVYAKSARRLRRQRPAKLTKML